MASDRWQHVDDLFHHALELPEEERRGYVEAHASDQDVAQEVQSLLEFHREHSDLVDEENEELAQAVRDAAALIIDSNPDRSTLEDSPVGAPATGASTVVGGPTSESTRHAAGWDVADAESRIKQILADREGRYELRKLVGRGGGGIVARVWDKSLHREVALKLLHTSELREAALERDPGGSESAYPGLLSESRSLAQVHSDFIVQIFEVGDSNKYPYILMEYVRGPSLRRLLTLQGALPPNQVAELARQIASGLVDAHERDLIHRDVKPSNVLLTRSASEKCGYRAKIIDFGLAREGKLTSHRQAIGIEGTPAYMAPELFDARSKVTPAADIYALGVTMYEMLTCTVPFRGAVHMLVTQKLAPVPAPRSLDDRIPLDLESVCLKAMAADASDRYGSMEQLREDLDRFLEGLPTQARPLPWWQASWRWAIRHKAQTIAVCLLFLLVALGSVGSSAFATLMWKKNQDIEQERLLTQAALESRILSADPDSLLLAIDQFQRLATNPVRQLRSLAAESETVRSKLNVNCALAILGEATQEQLVGLVPQAVRSSSQCRALAVALNARPKESMQLIDSAYPSANAEDQLRLATLAWHLGENRLLLEQTDHVRQTDQRTRFIHGLVSWCPHLDNSIAQAIDREHPALSACFMLGIGCMDSREFSPKQNARLKEAIAQLNESENCPASLASAARWVARQRGWSLETSSELPFHMLRMEPGKFSMGSGNATLLYEGRSLHNVRLTIPYLLADCEVDVGTFHSVLSESSDPAHREIAENWTYDEIVSPTDRFPAQKVSWFEAIAFCNALSIREELTPCYRLEGNVNVEFEEGTPKEIENWICDRSVNGYRLPTEAEWEYAARAGTTTDYSFGNDRKFLEYYGHWSNNTRVEAKPCGTLMPNPWGLFDMHGNVWEWAEDWFYHFEEEGRVDPCSTQPTGRGRSYRGGGIATFSGDPLSNSRGSAPPYVHYMNQGFRVARTVATDD